MEKGNRNVWSARKILMKTLEMLIATYIPGRTSLICETYDS